MGVKGAVYATIIGQIISCIVGLIFHLIFNKEITNSIKYIIPSSEVIARIYAIGLPAIIAQALMSVMTYGLNIIFVKITVTNGEFVVTAYSLYYKIQQFILFAAFGLRDTITPVVSFNQGMKSKSRIDDGIKYGMIYTFALIVAICFVQIINQSIYGVSVVWTIFPIAEIITAVIAFLMYKSTYKKKVYNLENPVKVTA